MVGMPACPADVPENPGRRALDFVHRLLATPSTDHLDVRSLLAELAGTFDATASGIARLADGTSVAQSGVVAPGRSRWPWEVQPELLTQVRRTRAVLVVDGTEEGSLLLTTAQEPGETGWLFWLEHLGRKEWHPAETAAFKLATMALAHRLATDTTLAQWGEQLEVAARQQQMETTASVVRRLAHDFGNMITGIMGFSELCLTQKIPTESTLYRYLQEIYRGAQASAAYTNMLRIFSRRHTVSPRASSLESVLRDEQSRLSASWPSGQFQMELPADLPQLAIDTDQLRQVLSALIENAREAAGANGTIRVSARRVLLGSVEALNYYGSPHCGENVEIEVADNGPGLSPEAQQRLFAEPFFTSKSRARGFGLAIAYGILHVYRSGFRLFSTPGSGTSARVVIPAAISQATSLTHRNHAIGGPVERVLVVDDDPVVLQFVSTTLEQAGYTVKSASDGNQALTFFRARGNEPFHLVVTDVLMPDIDGVELTRQLLEIEPGIRVLFMSGYCGNGFSIRDLDRHQFQLLQKPFRVDALLSAVRAVLERAPVPSSNGTGESKSSSVATSTQ